MSATHLSHLRGKDEVLTNLALGYMQSDFIGERIMPVVYTDKEGIKVPVLARVRSWNMKPSERSVQQATSSR